MRKRKVEARVERGVSDREGSYTDGELSELLHWCSARKSSAVDADQAFVPASDSKQSFHDRMFTALSDLLLAARTSSLPMPNYLLPDVVRLIVEYLPSHRIYGIRRERFNRSLATCRLVCLYNEYDDFDAPEVAGTNDIMDEGFRVQASTVLQAVVHDASRSIYVMDTFNDRMWIVRPGADRTTPSTYQELKSVMPFDHLQGATVISARDSIWIGGGVHLDRHVDPLWSSCVSDLWRFDLPTNVWHQGRLPHSMSGHSLTFVPSGSVRQRSGSHTGEKTELAVIGGNKDVLILIGGEVGPDVDDEDADPRDPRNDTKYIKSCYYTVLTESDPDHIDDNRSDDNLDRQKSRRTESSGDVKSGSRLSPELCRWRSFAPLRFSRAGHGSALFDGCIVVAGGMGPQPECGADTPDELVPVDAVEVFRLSEPDAGWAHLTSLPAEQCRTNGLRLLSDRASLFALEALPANNTHTVHRDIQMLRIAPTPTLCSRAFKSAPFLCQETVAFVPISQG